MDNIENIHESFFVIANKCEFWGIIKILTVKEEDNFKQVFFRKIVGAEFDRLAECGIKISGLIPLKSRAKVTGDIYLIPDIDDNNFWNLIYHT